MQYFKQPHNSSVVFSFSIRDFSSPKSKKIKSAPFNASFPAEDDGGMELK